MWRSLLPELLMPLPVSIVLLLWGVWRRRLRLVMAGVGVLCVAALPVTGWVATRAVEDWAVRGAVEQMPTADAIVVLSYGMVVAPGAASVEWHEPDRFFGGLALWKAGRAPRLVVTGGPIRGLPTRTEGDVLREMAVNLGVPVSSITVTPRVGTTRDEAEAVRRLLPDVEGRTARILLVTSASHMPRAARAFERVGLVVTRFPVDFRSADRLGWSVALLLPTPGALMQTHTAVREWYGRLVYALTGG